jgi:hypothetical protein
MAAGLGYKEFTTGDVLTAADANGYLASQVVMVFADSAARTTAITSPQEGMISFLKDTNSTEYYSGSAWVAIGGSSSPLTTKGDLYGFSTTNARVAVGTNGQVLAADSTEATGVKWITPSASAFSGVSAFKSTNQSVSNATNTVLTFDSESFDTNAYHSTSTNTSRITIPAGKAGYYNLTANIVFGTSSAGIRQINFAKNGAAAIYTLQMSASSASETIVSVSYLIKLLEADYVEAFVYQTSGGSLNIIGNGAADFTTFSAAYLGA